MLESKLSRSIHNHFNHITWFCRNSASVSLLATLSHRTWIVNDVSSFQLFQKRSKISDCIFLKILLQTKFFFFTHFWYAKSTFNNDRRLYKMSRFRVNLLVRWSVPRRLISENERRRFISSHNSFFLFHFFDLLLLITK
jgi:hypothetical protein